MCTVHPNHTSRCLGVFACVYAGLCGVEPQMEGSLSQLVSTEGFEAGSFTESTAVHLARLAARDLQASAHLVLHLPTLSSGVPDLLTPTQLTHTRLYQWSHPALVLGAILPSFLPSLPKL